MIENIITKPLGVVLIVTAHMVFNGSSHAQVTGSLGSNITLQFTFNVSINKESLIGIYILGEKKISQYPQGKDSFDVYPHNDSVFYHITNLSQNDSNIYWAKLFLTPPISSNIVKLTVRNETSRSTVSTMMPDYTTPPHENKHYNLISIQIVIILVVLPVVLLATVLPWLICSLVKSKDNHQQTPHQSSNPTVPETIESSRNVTSSSLVYSVLDFPKRPPAVVEINPRDTEYAAVSYLTEKRKL